MKTIDFTTAQHVRIEYDLASTGARVLASFIDVFAFLVYALIMSAILGVSLISTELGTQEVMYLLVLRIPWFFYSPVIEYLTRGQSLGKYALGIRVVSLNGENAGMREYFTRWIFRVIDIWFGFGFLAILFSSTSERGQRMGDVMANTVVIRKKSSQNYTLRNVLAIKSQDNYQTTYDHVIHFTDEDMMLIKSTIQRVEQHPSPATQQFAIELAHQTARSIGLSETPAKKLEFLRTVLMDYVVLTR
jgi:uncharacterized RDD family membrane protein YckC